MIEARGVYFFLEDGPYMPSLEHLIDHYSRFADGLPFKLCHPLFKVLKAKDPTYALGKFILIGKLLFDKICNSLFISYFGTIFWDDIFLVTQIHHLRTLEVEPGLNACQRSLFVQILTPWASQGPKNLMNNMK